MQFKIQNRDIKLYIKKLNGYQGKLDLTFLDIGLRFGF